jgi:hypothetical protein
MRISIGVQQCKYCRPAMSAWTQVGVDNFAGKYFNHAENK